MQFIPRRSVIGRYFYRNFPIPWTIKFTKINCLPGTEHQLGIVDEDALGGADERGFDMGIRIPFCMGKIRIVGNELAEEVGYVPLHGRVGPFVDGYPGRGVKHEQVTDAVVYRAVPHHLLHLSGDVYELRSVEALKGNVFDHVCSPGATKGE